METTIPCLHRNSDRTYRFPRHPQGYLSGLHLHKLAMADRKTSTSQATRLHPKDLEACHPCSRHLDLEGRLVVRCRLDSCLLDILHNYSSSKVLLGITGDEKHPYLGHRIFSNARIRDSIGRDYSTNVALFGAKTRRLWMYYERVSISTFTAELKSNLFISTCKKTTVSM